MIKAVIFDWDGLLVDSEPFHTKAVQYTLKKGLGVNISKKEVHEYLGLVYREKIKMILDKKDIKADVEKLAKDALEYFIKISPGKMKLMPGAAKLLNALGKNNFKIGMYTSGNNFYVLNMIAFVKVKNMLDAVVTGDDVKKRKPDPEGYLLAAKKLGVNPIECVGIEDSNPGVEAVRNAGMKCVAVPNKYLTHQNFSKADLVIKSLKDVTVDIIRSL